MIGALDFFDGPAHDHPAEDIFDQVQIIIRAPDRTVQIRDIPAPDLVRTSRRLILGPTMDPGLTVVAMGQQIVLF